MAGKNVIKLITYFEVAQTILKCLLPYYKKVQ